ncbi:hypothetical protein IHE44_0009326 [Lamprotornis superbus]|uniref:Uncharacterized protein n=1 Tax=Lamprotornis superbus TaxID=245042 RepID=A0A835P490_9PASS|nr:hypothetical protein IHE44_0009326 [Lamprotornis superbus]
MASLQYASEPATSLLCSDPSSGEIKMLALGISLRLSFPSLLNLLVEKFCEHLYVFSQCLPFCRDSVPIAINGVEGLLRRSEDVFCKSDTWHRVANTRVSPTARCRMGANSNAAKQQSKCQGLLSL